MSLEDFGGRVRNFFIKGLIGISALGLFAGLVILVMTFYPIAKQEVQYAVRQSQQTNLPPAELEPVDKEFGIVIPKIGANSRVLSNIDPYDSALYQQALSQGVAHAAGTVLPGEEGNSFLFSHSSVNFYEASRYNSIFYLLNKLETGDKIDIYRQGEKLTFIVTATGLYNPQAVEFLRPDAQGKTLNLMTCWPPGTTLQRLIVTAQLES
jgi:sortase A